MSDHELISILEKVLTVGGAGNLRDLLSDDCVYESDYAHKTIVTPTSIIERMEFVDSHITDECRYSSKVVDLKDVLRREPDADQMPDGCRLNPYGIMLFQYDAVFPAAVAMEILDVEGKISKIWLSRDKSLLNLDFNRREVDEDSPRDLPCTVKPLNQHDRQVRAMRDAFSGQHLDLISDEITDGLYIWRKADEFMEDWLPANGYSVSESKVFPECIGYRCARNGLLYVVYMYAYGTQKTTGLDGEYCSQLLHLDFSAGRTVLVVYLNVWQDTEGEKPEYEVMSYSGKSYSKPELWRVSKVQGKFILEYYPRKEIEDATYKLMYAFNRNDLDAYDSIVSRFNPSFTGLDYPGSFMNDAFYHCLHKLHEKYGDMKIGYVRFNDVIYSMAPYLEGYGFFDFTYGEPDRISAVTVHPLEGRKKNVREFIKTEKREDDSWFSDIPALVSVQAFPPTETERFALKLSFDNGESRKYVLKMKINNPDDEVVSWRGRVFTDKIWASAAVADHLDAEYKGYTQRRAAVAFKNGYFISCYQCWLESTPYSEPVLCGDTIYEDDNLKVERVWKWNVNSLYVDEETGLVKTLISGDAFNCYGKSIFVTKDGKRVCSIDADQIGNFSEGMAKIAKNGVGYGYVNSDLEFVIPMQYECAEDFHDGKARVRRYGRWLFVDRTGKETKIDTAQGKPRYQDVCDYSEGLARVSTLKLGLVDFAYHFDWSEIAGNWGYVNEAGEEIIPPQYICAEDFREGIAFVCKGEWTIDPKWDNKYNKGRYWSEEMLWGAIDKEGNTVIPFIFDEIKHFYSPDVDYVSNAHMAHIGGWENGRWGVIDEHGNWLAEPVFEDIGYECHDGKIIFYDRDSWDDDALQGVYDFRQKKVILEPQFYDIDFRSDELLQVEVNDEELGRHIEKLIDLTGKEKFHSVYTFLHAWKKPPYQVVIREDNGDKIGLIDENGNVLVPCQSGVAWDGILYDQKRIIFMDGKKKGIRDFDGNIIIPAIYQEIHNASGLLLGVRIGEGNKYTEGILTRDGAEVVPAVYRYVHIYNDQYITCCRQGHCEMLRYYDKRTEVEAL